MPRTEFQKGVFEDDNDSFVAESYDINSRISEIISNF